MTKSIFNDVTVEVSDDGSSGWTAVPNVKSFAIPEESVNYIDATDLDSAGGYREFLTGLKEIGDATLVQNYTRAAMTQLEADRFSTKFYRVTFPILQGETTGDTLTFQAIRSGSATPGGDLEAINEISNTLRGTGAPVFAAGS